LCDKYKYIQEHEILNRSKQEISIMSFISTAYVSQENEIAS